MAGSAAARLAAQSRTYERGYKKYIVPGPGKYWGPGG